ncbi:MAG: hypothetical protein F6K37_40475 [Moorea sp. SIO4E2]|nr:hypothetical protein [Moorena sp. SIO4E2]
MKGYTAIIRDVNENAANLTKLNGEPITTIEIQTGHRKYQLGGIIAPISPVECQWLIQELKDWLGLT